MGGSVGRGVDEMEGRGDRAALGCNDLVGEGVTAADDGGAAGDITPPTTGCADADRGNDRIMKAPIVSNAEYSLAFF